MESHVWIWTNVQPAFHHVLKIPPVITQSALTNALVILDFRWKMMGYVMISMSASPLNLSNIFAVIHQKEFVLILLDPTPAHVLRGWGAQARLKFHKLPRLISSKSIRNCHYDKPGTVEYPLSFNFRNRKTIGYAQIIKILSQKS